MNTKLLAWWLFYKQDSCEHAEPETINEWLVQYQMLGNDAAIRDRLLEEFRGDVDAEAEIRGAVPVESGPHGLEAGDVFPGFSHKDL